MNAIELKNLKKCYNKGKKNEKWALNGVDLQIPKGSFFGLLGPNGAGKSTIINIIAGLVNKTEGEAFVCGHNVESDTRQARYKLGVVPQELILDPFFPVYQVLENTAGYYGVRKKDRRTDEIIEALGLTDKKYAAARSLSGGMRRRLLVAKALVHNPEVIILDEPTAGVDVELRRQLWEYVKKLNKEKNVTIVLTTHYLEEAEELCDYIAVINKGNIVANDSKKNIMKILDYKKIIISLANKISSLPKELKSIDNIEISIKNQNQIEINYKISKINIKDILNLILKQNLDIIDISTSEPDLEDVFTELVA